MTNHIYVNSKNILNVYLIR